MEKEKVAYITTPIYYASGAPHIGHAYTTILADVLKRYKKLLGYQTFLSTGVDEFGQKIETLAAKNNLTPKAFLDLNCQKFIDLFTMLGIEYDAFVRTTNPTHIQTVQQIFTQMQDNHDIYLGQWEGYYCVNCEENYSLSQIQNQDGKLMCKVGHEITKKNEESFFFNISKYSNWINHYLLEEYQDLIVPKARVNELRNNFLNDLSDLSVSRTTINWGIDVPNNSRHKIYVWLDALFNYVSILGYLGLDDSNYQKFWANPNSERIHLMSKEITRFHCIYWPIFLHSLNLNLPTKIFAHGWIITKEGKMSKSLGNVIDPVALINSYGRDILRYFFMKETSLSRDSIYSLDLFLEINNTDLANNIGNLVSRTIGMLNKYNEGFIPKYVGIINANDNDIQKGINNLLNKLVNWIDNLEIDTIVNETIKLIKLANKYIEDIKPWELAKENKIDSLNSLLTHLCLVIRVVIVVLSPILIDGTKNMIEQMNFNDKLLNLESCLNFSSLDNIQVHESHPIYQRYKID